MLNDIIKMHPIGLVALQEKERDISLTARTQGEDRERIRGESSHPQARKRALTGHQPCWQPDTGLAASRTEMKEP